MYEIRRSCGTRGTEEKHVQSLGVESAVKRPLGRPMGRRKGSVSMGVK